MRLRVRLLSVAVAAALVVPVTARAAEIDYRTWSEGLLVMLVQDLFTSKAKLYNLGESSTPGINQYGLLISEDADDEDAGTKNAVVFECGMHAREWFAVESCYWLIDYLYFNRNSDEVKELLQHVDVWVLPQTNPAGRNLDDLGLGDPTQFIYYCKDGSNGGDACSTNADCPSSSCYRTGWRTNANKSTCDVGVDLARNFSSDWNDAAPMCSKDSFCGDNWNSCTSNSDCTSGGTCKSRFIQYRGPDPFSEIETRNLRKFIHNHMVSMVTIVHANAQKTHNLWYSSNAASQFMTDSLVSMNWAGSSSWSPNPAMARVGVGGGSGQFSAWLTTASDVSGELDDGTHRRISTFFFEVPVTGDNYQAPYRNSSGDDSNSFHPSDVDMENLWEDAIRDMMLYVIRQARAPQCPTTDALNPRIDKCDDDDFGLVGAKIAKATDEPGLLDYSNTTREETLPAGNHEIVFAVQNYSALQANTTTNATVTVTKNGSLDATYVEAFTLSFTDRETRSVSHTFVAGSEYRVDISLDSDDFSRNNTKIFAFYVPTLFVLAPPLEFGSGKVKVKEGLQGIADDRLKFKADFISDHQIRPEVFGIDILIHGFPPQIPIPLPDPIPVLYKLPEGTEWWDKSHPAKGKWLYKDRDAVNTAIRKLKIVRRVKDDAPTVTKVRFNVKNADLDVLDESRAWTVDVKFPSDNLILLGVANARRVRLPDKLMEPTDENEDHPHTEPGGQ